MDIIPEKIEFENDIPEQTEVDSKIPEIKIEAEKMDIENSVQPLEDSTSRWLKMFNVCFSWNLATSFENND